MKGVLGITNKSLNERYLGLPLDVGREKNGTFSYIKERIWRRVQGWMEKMLPGRGKGVLIKSIVQAISTYSMSMFKLPRGLCECITSMIRKFWWGSKGGERKTAWVSWDSMCMLKYRGGLGFRDMELFNLWLLARRSWRILQDQESLSSRILKAVYFPAADFIDAEVGTQNWSR